jgi:hypothetical protein
MIARYILSVAILAHFLVLPALGTPFSSLEVSGKIESNPGNDGVVFRGTLGTGTLPASGAGVRMMWYPAKAAFRFGGLDSNYSWAWDITNTGTYSVAGGSNSMAMGSMSVSLGGYNTASGPGSIALGYSSYGAGDYMAGVAIGYHTTTSGYGGNVALGVYTNAGGFTGATAMGEYTTASSQGATAMGFHTTANQTGATAAGAYTLANGQYATSLGYSTTATSYASTVVGRFNVIQGTSYGWFDTEPLFVVGNGTDAQHPKDALVVKKNGDVVVTKRQGDIMMGEFGNPGD